MDESDRLSFEHHLTKLGKKPHVVQGLVQHVVKFEEFLQRRGKKLEAAREQDIFDYATETDAREPGAAGKAMRGVALYYRYKGTATLVRTASSMREKAVATKRKVFKLSDFKGVDRDTLERLKAIGITNIEQMLAAGRTASLRHELAERVGIPESNVLELVKLSDLARLPGVKAIRARLYFNAGLDTVETIAGYKPQDMLRISAEFVERTGFEGIAPLPKEVFYTIEAARKLPKVVDYTDKKD